jgi:hypothetical protein
VLGRVDPRGGGQGGRLRGNAIEAPRMGDERSLKSDGPLRGERGSAAIVDGGRRHQADPAVTVFVVVSLEELLAMGAGIFDAAKARGKIRTVLQRLELGF